MNIAFWTFWLLGLAVSTLLGAAVVKYMRPLGLVVLGGFLAIYVVGANILVPRLVNFSIFGLSFVLVSGSIIWPYTAQLSDMINEIYGKTAAYFTAAMGYVANLMFVGFTYMAFNLPPLWDAQQEGWFTQFFGVAGRVVIASICSYTLANVVDINLFALIKKTFAKVEDNPVTILAFSTVRSVTSDAANMIIDNIVFYSIAFYGTMPNEVLIGIIGSSMVAKVILSQIDIPFYWLFRMITRDVERTF